jgi:C4-dicarboxylate-specific signal transduction histidine kinase
MRSGLLRTFEMFSFLLSLAAPAVGQPRRVVLLYDERTELPGLAALDARLGRTLTAGLPGVEVYREAMDLSRFQSDTYSTALKDFLRAKYADKHIDVVIAAMGPALDFLLAHGREVFPGTPIVFCGIDRRELGDRQLPSNVTGVLLKREFEPTLELALKLHPRTQRVVFVAGSSEFDQRLTDVARAEFAQGNHPPIDYLIGLPLPDLRDTLAKLPPRMVVLYSTMFADDRDQSYVPHQVAEQIAAAATAPVYAFMDQYLGRGIVGGHLYSVDAHGEEAARLALRILHGARPSDIPPVERASSLDLFDGRQLTRWGIDEARLPAGSVVQFREVSPWDRYQTTIVAIAGVLLLQSALIVALLLERRVRRRAQSALLESQARAEIAGVSLGVGFWSWDPDRDRVWISEQCARLLGLERRSYPPLAGFLDAVRPHTAGALDDAFEQAMRGAAPFDGEWAVATPTGGRRWIAGAIRTTEDGNSRRRVTGALVDVTERRSAERLAEEQRRELSHLGRVAVVGELSAALAHEINQPLAAILANTRAAQRMLENGGLDMTELRAILDDIESDDRRAGAVIQRVRGLVKKDDGELQVVLVNDVVGEVLELAHSDLIHRGVVVNTRLLPSAPAIVADRVQLQQVLLNLIMNACDAMSHTPPAERGLVIATSVENGVVRIAVHDRGTGISADSLESVFEPFVTSKKNGLGLGLAICRSIVRSHGGNMWASNNPDRGATIVVSLPMATEPRTTSGDHRGLSPSPSTVATAAASDAGVNGFSSSSTGSAMSSPATASAK